MTAVFADTFYWIALISRKDSAHAKVLQFEEASDGRDLVTTDEVLTEFLAFCAAEPRLRVQAALIVQDLLDTDGVRVMPQTHASFLDGLELYGSRPDKGYSLTDCISMTVMRREGITDALTNDRHFEQEGFRAVFRT